VGGGVSPLASARRAAPRAVSAFPGGPGWSGHDSGPACYASPGTLFSTGLLVPPLVRLAGLEPSALPSVASSHGIAHLTAVLDRATVPFAEVLAAPEG
jgi:hypothetical protein